MSEAAPNPETRIALFQQKEVRRAIHNNEWWFVISDVVAALTDSPDPGDYFKKLRKRDPSLAESFKGGDNLPPPWPRVRDLRRTSTAPMLSLAQSAKTVKRLTRKAKPMREEEPL
jgi:hypothetical protein